MDSTGCREFHVGVQQHEDHLAFDDQPLWKETNICMLGKVKILYGLGRGGFSVNRKKTMFFENRNTRCYFWRKTEKPKKTKNRGKKGKNEEKSVFY
jgi:hypothetical protein